MSDRAKERQRIAKTAAIKTYWEAGHSKSKISKITGFSYQHVKNMVDRFENEKAH